jgi:hypothetical protein
VIFRIAIALAFGLSVLLADDTSQPEPKLVDLTVIAVDNHGQSVKDLASEDFQVSDAGKQQKIAFSRRNDSKLWRVPSLGPNEFSNHTGPEIPRATVILFDLLNESFARFEDQGMAAGCILEPGVPIGNMRGSAIVPNCVDGGSRSSACFSSAE